MRWWQIRLPLVVLAAVCLALVMVSPGEGAPPVRPKVTWQHTENPECSERPSNTDPICIAVQPGDGATVSATLTVDGDVVKPRILFMSGNGADVIKAVPATALPPVMSAGDSVVVNITVGQLVNVRARSISGRVYLADRFSVLSRPLNIRIKILHPTPEEIARTPVVVPTNHIQMVMRPPSMVQGVNAARFNVRHLVVTNNTNVTWTNRAPTPGDANLKRAVKGTLCDPTKPLSPSRKCDLDPATLTPCALTVDPVEDHVETDAQGRVLCFLSPELAVSGHYSIRITRPLTRQPLTYYMEDALHDPDTMVEIVSDRQYHPYLTVK